MKKTVFLIALSLLTLASFAQMKKDRTSAYNSWQKSADNKAQLLKAKEFIDKAIEYPEAETDSKVWYFRGGIYLDLHISQEYKPMFPDALATAYDAYIKAKKLDTKNEFATDIAVRMLTIGGQLFNEGINYFQVQNFDKALGYFEKALQVANENKSTDTLALYGTALCYEKKEETQKAIDTYQNLVDMKMNEPSIYVSLGMLYKDRGEFEKSTRILEQGRSRYPDNIELIIGLANVNIATKSHQKAIESLETALAKEPNNASVLYAMGVTYDLLKNDTTLSASDRSKYFDLAVKNYKRTLEIDPAFFDAIFNLGALYFNKGGDQINAANKLPLNESVKYDMMMEEGNNNLKSALPYFEQAEKLQPNDKATLASLKEIYTRLKMYDKLKLINDKLGSN